MSPWAAKFRLTSPRTPACHCGRLDGQPEGFSGLLLGIRRGKKLVPIGRVGTGFPQKLLKWLEPLETDTSPFAAPVPRKSGRIIHWAKPELIAEVEYTSWTNDGVLRQASRQEVFERSDRKRLDWINLPGDGE